uniref:DC_STAMP domain-containing protein n=1 Tax=Loa loa TaxID=7209 RepID=A0A1I7VYM8_LOALO
MLINVLRRPKQRALKKLEELHFVAENCRRSITGEEPLVDKHKEFWMKCGIYFPPLYPSPKPTPRNAYERMFIHGTRLGVHVSIVVQLILGLMIPFPSIRGIILIATTKLTTSQLRSIILMFMIVWAFQIPATNTTRNLQMLAESVACVSNSAIQIGNKVVTEINMQTNKLSLSELKEQGRFFAKHLKNFRDIMRRLQNIVVKFGKQTKDYLMQLLTVKEHCQRFFIGPYYFVRIYYCLRIFDDSAQYCDRLSLYRRLPICDAARFGELVCDIPEKIKESLKSGFLTFTKDKMKAAMNVVMNDYNISFFAALVYVMKYKQKEKADNVYITEEFRNVDMVREAQGQPSLLPLLLKERETYIEGFTLHMTSKEKMRMLFAFAITLIGGFTPVFLILLDIFTYQILYFTYSSVQSNRTRTDRLDFYNLKAAGEGFVAKLLQRILHIFYPITGSQYSDDDWRQCFAEPSPPDFQLTRLMMLLYLIAFLLCILQVYVVRCRHLIAQYYWPERTKPRTLWLYNQLLEGRKNILTQLVKAAKEKELKDQLVEDEISGRGNLVNRGLTVLNVDQYKCTRCFRSDLSIADASNSRICPNCNNLYCTDCYAVKNKCLECGASLQNDFLRISCSCSVICILCGTYSRQY